MDWLHLFFSYNKIFQKSVDKIKNVDYYIIVIRFD